MAERLYHLVSNAEDLLALEPEELAGIVLELFNSRPNFTYSKQKFGLESTVSEYPTQHQDMLLRALMEAWVWLEHEGLIAPLPAQEGWYFVTRRGKQITKAADLQAFHRADLLPKRLLHPVIAQKVWSTFLRGDYDTAVFQAFKEVEVRVRVAGGFDAHDLGTDLMRKAFHVETGPLTDKSVVKSERQALSDLFAGAIGQYKNPHSHRHVSIQAEDAVDMIFLASHLCKIVDAKTSSS